ncbi:hypothetical protein HDR70_06600 [bacterium]|nr:hypothetical protein [bacterium]
MTTALTRLAAKALPALSGSPVIYIPEKNVYVTPGYTSASGNTYYKALRYSDYLAVHYDIGEGYARTFLNGITLYCWDGPNGVIIGKKMWGGYGNWVGFSEHFAMEQTVQMLKNYLAGQAKILGQYHSEQQLLSFSRQMVEDIKTYQKRIA